MAYSALDIAKKIIVTASDEEKGEAVSNLKLQKLLYYVQGIFIAVYGEKVFDERIEAWQYGPVVPLVYEHYKEFKANPITIEDKEDILAFESTGEEELFKEIIEEYGQFSALGLMNKSHNEMPWQKVFGENPQGEITMDLLDTYFKTQVI